MSLRASCIVVDARCPLTRLVLNHGPSPRNHPLISNLTQHDAFTQKTAIRQVIHYTTDPYKRQRNGITAPPKERLRLSPNLPSRSAAADYSHVSAYSSSCSSSSASSSDSHSSSSSSSYSYSSSSNSSSSPSHSSPSANSHASSS